MSSFRVSVSRKTSQISIGVKIGERLTIRVDIAALVARTP
jgi:hypothetical protein